MTEHELMLYRKCTAKYKKKHISRETYNEFHEYNSDINEENDHDR